MYGHSFGTPHADEPVSIHPACDGSAQTAALPVGGAKVLAPHASLCLGYVPDGDGDTTAALTPTEARQLAAALLRQAAADEHPDDSRGTGRVVASYVGGESYAATTRGHAVCDAHRASKIRPINLELDRSRQRAASLAGRGDRCGERDSLAGHGGIS